MADKGQPLPSIAGLRRRGCHRGPDCGRRSPPRACPRGRVIRYRLAKGLPLTWGDNEEEANEGGSTPWRTSPGPARPLAAFAAQTLADVREVRRLIARGQATAADQLLDGMHDSAMIAGVSMDDAGANRPAGMRPRPTGRSAGRGGAGSQRVDRTAGGSNESEMSAEIDQAKAALDKARAEYARALLAVRDAPGNPEAQQQFRDAGQAGRRAWRRYQETTTAGLAAQIEGIVPDAFRD